MTDAGTAQAAPSEPEQRITAVPVKGSDQSNADGLPRMCPPAPHLARVPKGARSGSLGAAALPPRGEDERLAREFLRPSVAEIKGIMGEGWVEPESLKAKDAILRLLGWAETARPEGAQPGPEALPPDAHADAATIRDNLTHIGTWDDEAKHSPNCPGCQAEAALARLVAALPDAPAETHTEATA